MEAFRGENLVTKSAAIVAVNEHSGNPQFEPREDHSARIKEGDFVLLDIWGKKNTPNAVYYDITWTGFVGAAVPERHAKIFEIVRNGRDAGVQVVQSAMAAKRRLEGWEVDKATGNSLTQPGYGEYLVNRNDLSICTSV